MANKFIARTITLSATLNTPARLSDLIAALALPWTGVPVFNFLFILPVGAGNLVLADDLSAAFNTEAEGVVVPTTGLTLGPNAQIDASQLQFLSATASKAFSIFGTTAL